MKASMGMASAIVMRAMMGVELWIDRCECAMRLELSAFLLPEIIIDHYGNR